MAWKVSCVMDERMRFLGEVLMEERKVLTIDEARLRADVQKKSGEIRSALLQVLLKVETEAAKPTASDAE